MSFRYACSLTLLTFASIPMLASAQDFYVDDVIPGEASGSINGSGSLGIPGGYVWARGDFGERPGVDGNYFSTGAFAPMQIWGPDQITYLDGQIFVNEKMGPGGDIGLGHRAAFRTFDMPWAVGVNGFLTWDESINGSRNRRGSVGVEWMSEYFHANANYYIPIDESPDRFGPVNRTKESVFNGTNLAFLNRQMAEQQMEGVDFEAGVQVPYFEWVTLSGGGYYYDSELGENVRGATAKVGIDLNSAVFDVTLQKDSLYGTTVNFGAEIRAGANGIEIGPQFRNFDSKVFDRVRRRARIALQQVELVDQELAINPATGRPFDIIHVDNTAAAGGDGSNENRFNQLDLANGPDGDIILVHRGDTTRDNLLPGGGGLFLDDNQIIIGEGTPFVLQAANRLVACPLPGVDQMGTHPFITADAGADVITLANNNQVLGLNIIAPTNGTQIASNGASEFIVDDINQNIAMGRSTGPGGGIVLNNATGTGMISNYLYRGENITAPGGIVVMNNNVADLDLTITDVDLEMGRFGIDLVATNSEINAAIDNVQGDMNGTGMRVDARDGGEVTAIISNSTLDNAMGMASPIEGHGIVVTGTNGGNARLIASNTTANNAKRDGLHVNLDDATGRATITDGSLNMAGDDGVGIELTNGADFNGTLTRTPGTMATDNGIEIIADNSAAVVTLDDSDFEMAGNNGMLVGLTNNATTTINGTDSSFANAMTGDGLNVNAASGSQFNGTFSNGMGSPTGTFANAADDGIDLTFSASTGNTLTLNNADANNAMGGSGLKYNVTNRSDFTANLTNVSLDNAAMHAIEGDVVGLSNATITGSGVSGFSADDDAINQFVSESTLDLTLTDSGSFAEAMGDGLEIMSRDNSVADISITGNGGPVNFNDAMGYGLRSNTLNNSTTTFNFANGATFDNVGADAIFMNAVNGSTANLTGDAVSGFSADADAVELIANNSTVNFTLTNAGNFSEAGEDGLQYTGSNGGTLNMSIAGVTGTPANFSNATQSGVNGSLTGATGNLTLTDANFDDAGQFGLVNSSDDSTLVANLTDTTFANAEMDALNFTLANGANDDININGVNGSNSRTGSGLVVTADGASNSDIDVTGTGANFSDGMVDGIRLASNGLSVVDFTGSNVSGANVGEDGIDLDADNARINVTLPTGGDFTNTGGDGLNYTGTNNATIVLNMTDVNFDDMPGTPTGFGARGTLTDSTATVNMTNVSMNNAGLDGFGIVADNSTITSALNNIAMNDAGRDAFSIVSSNLSDVTVVGDTLNGANAGNDGIHIVHDASTSDVRLTNVGNFSGATNDGLNAVISNGSHPDFNLEVSGVAGNRANFNNAGHDGLNITLNTFDGFNAIDPLFTIGEANFENTNHNGFTLTSNGVSGPGTESSFNGLITNASFNDAGKLMPIILPGGNGLEANLSGNPFSRLLMDNVTLNDARVDAVNITATDATFFDIDILTPGGGGSGLTGAGDDQTDLTPIGSVIDIFVD